MPSIIQSKNSSHIKKIECSNLRYKKKYQLIFFFAWVLDFIEAKYIVVFQENWFELAGGVWQSSNIYSNDRKWTLLGLITMQKPRLLFIAFYIKLMEITLKWLSLALAKNTF